MGATIVQEVKTMSKEIADAVDLAEESDLKMADLTELCQDDDPVMAGACGGHVPNHAN